MTRPLALMPNIVILSNESAQSLSSPYDFSGGEQISPPMETPSLSVERVGSTCRCVLLPKLLLQRNGLEMWQVANTVNVSLHHTSYVVIITSFCETTGSVDIAISTVFPIDSILFHSLPGRGIERWRILCQLKWMEIAVGKGVSAVFMNCGSSEKMTVWRIQFRCTEMAAVTIVSELSIIDDGLPWLSLLTGRLGMGVNFVRFPPALDRMDDPKATGT
ncbi:hypothetical protein BLNAU_17065 [Blattamonas nauphoetae]|uniref:Uncharacterized protein n=1 Tax=Blattamonas nauphoetae TaxID=2049346 RepID=A0ABQ9X9E5_9EUKA|nr:hypothetical protein BLNAU_17065 [Blattamonas nauphoetae]